MNCFYQTYERIKKIHNLIALKSTGSPEQLAEKLDISKSYLYILINLMKDLGAPIFFDRYTQSYCYGKEIRIAEKLFYEEIDEKRNKF